MKAMLSIAVYLVLVFALGLVTAFTTAPEPGQPDELDDAT